MQQHFYIISNLSMFLLFFYAISWEINNEIVEIGKKFKLRNFFYVKIIKKFPALFLNVNNDYIYLYVIIMYI
jgi:hypothetical protein